MSALRSIRWWPALVVIALWLAFVTWSWTSPTLIGQEKVLRSLAATAVAVLLLLLWLALLSRLPWRPRLGALAAALAVLVVLAALFEIRGVTGDVMPIVRPRWAPRAGDLAVGPGGGGGVLEGRAGASDWPQFLGPRRNATVAGPPLAHDWERQPPRALWRQPIGAGWSGFAVAGGVAVTQEQRGDEELVTAYDLASGELLWSHGEAVRYETAIGGIGPRATPAVSGGRVFALGATGLLSALELATGRLLWQHDVLARHSASLPEWGKSSSPLVVDGRVVVSAGGRDGASLVAYEAVSGELAWAAGDDTSGYSSPLLATLDGVPQIVIFNQASVAGHHPGDGRVLWQHPWPASQPNVAQPVPLGEDRLFVSSGYGIGGKLLEVRRSDSGAWTVERLWESPRLKAKFTNVVVHEGTIYGLDDGVLVCLDPATGERCWKRGRYGHGQVILAGDLLLVQAEDGELVLLEPDPQEHRELARFPALDGKTWNSPALAGRYLLVRNHRQAACYELPLAAGDGAGEQAAASAR